MPNDSSIGVVEKLYTFEYDNIGTAAGDGIVFLNSSDASDTAFAATALRGGGVARGTTATTDDNMIELSRGGVNYRADDGMMSMEVRAYLDVVTNVAFNIGWNDEVLEGANTLPVELSTATFTRNGVTSAVILFDTDASAINTVFVPCWEDDSVMMNETVAANRFSGIAPVAAEYFTARVELWDRGAGNGARATFMVGRNNVSSTSGVKEFNTTVDRDALLAAHTSWENRSGTAHQVNISYMLLRYSLA